MKIMTHRKEMTKLTPIRMKHPEFLSLLGFTKRQCSRPTDFLINNPEFPHVSFGKSHKSFEVIFNEELIFWLWQSAGKKINLIQ
jgi:hypothetical protein